jgi:hypothetical protein
LEIKGADEAEEPVLNGAGAIEDRGEKQDGTCRQVVATVLHMCPHSAMALVELIS